MGSVIYDFFAESLLSHKTGIEKKFKRETVARLQQELESYRKHCIDNYSAIIKEIVDSHSTLKTFTSKEYAAIPFLTQTALYLDQIVLPDPIFKLTDRPTDLGKTMSKHLGFSEIKLDKGELARACEYLNLVTPMVAGDFVKFFPLSYFLERKVVPLYGPDHFFKDVIPKGALDYFRQNTEVRPITPMTNGKGWVITKDELLPCRAISIDLIDSDRGGGFVYFLYEIEVVEANRVTRKAIFRQTLPPDPPNYLEFWAWVEQSIRSAATNYFNDVSLEMQLAVSMEATYLTTDTFTSNLIESNLSTTETIQTFTANQFLNLELPFLPRVKIDRIMDLRRSEADAFTSFRIELDKNFRELRMITDPQQLKVKAENIVHELSVVQGRKIGKKFEHIKKQMALNTAIGVGTLVAGFAVSGYSFIGTALAAAKGYKDYNDYKEKMTENPAYFLWKVLR